MCETCGCSDRAQPTLTDLRNGRWSTIDFEGDELSHHNDNGEHDDASGHSTPAPAADLTPMSDAGHRHSKLVRLEQDVLARNNRLAERNRGWLAKRNILALNLVGAPGAGKTTLLERTIRDLAGEIIISVIEGDQATLADAQRIDATGCRVVQINTGTGCHLEADMVARGLEQLDPPENSVVMIENVGNLVCPALFDLGERAKVVIATVTDGEDKPLKYPHMFRASQVMLLNKTDLLPHVRFNTERCLDYARQVNPKLCVLPVSATRGDGLANWYTWLREHVCPPPTLCESVTN